MHCRGASSQWYAWKVLSPNRFGLLLHNCNNPQTVVLKSFLKVWSTYIQSEYQTPQWNLRYQWSIPNWTKNQNNITKILTGWCFSFCWFHGLLKDLPSGCKSQQAYGSSPNIGKKLFEANFSRVVPSKSKDAVFVTAFVDKSRGNKDPPLTVQLHIVILRVWESWNERNFRIFLNIADGFGWGGVWEKTRCPASFWSIQT